MRSLALASLLVSVSLVACVAGRTDEDSSSEQDLTLDASSGPVLVVVDGGAATPEGGPIIATDGGTSATLTYAEAGPIINAVCGQCHAGKFNSLDKVKANKTRMFNAVSAGRMPKNNTGWKNTREGRDVLDFLANSPELQ